ncbi:putative serine protease PepD [Krasilnikovia cinnamomea]|uniref:Putative serine protease PepD n=1 Tax=Krasilnikovia cinnamomea TaxID=349313 RepID=A0A4V2G6U3_9ACTN|nr:trypsin-like peptidase domain-containing protein [Krasilnikovia cinnamomea]RZU50016.1 putative serine protease PepD [Krasilnikovia cinnamomea]
MTEFETHPQRSDSSSSEEPSYRPADASQESSIAQRGESDPTVVQPTVAPAVAAEATTSQPEVAAPAAPQSDAPQSAAPQSGAPQPGAPAGQPGGWASPWQQPHPAYAGQQYPGQHHPGYAPQPQYATAGAPGGHGAPGGWGGGSAESAPVWAAPVGAADPRDPGKPGRGRKILVAGAAAAVIAIGAGGVGAAAALALSDDHGNATVPTSNSSVTRVVDRSSMAQIAAAVQDSVVSITTGSGEGSGVIISNDGYVVTNNHVVATARGNTVQVIFANGKKADATIVGTDPRTDLAVVKASGVSDLNAAHFGDSSKMQVGDTVLAIGSPLGLEGSVTAGIISAKDRTIRSGGEGPQAPFGNGQAQSAPTTMSGLLQTDAPINPGNSGGALVNTNGEIIGINSAIATSGQNSGNIGLGFAIPSNKAKQVADALMAGRKVSHPALGVSVAEAQGGGALVSSVTKDSAAAKAGLQQGDVITSVNGKSVGDSDDLVGIVQSASVGDKVTIVYTRDGAQKTVTAQLQEAS